jgi:membrane protease YdiL (CAAX protease family)
MRPLLEDQNIAIATALVFMFLQINFSPPEIGAVYAGMAVLYWAAIRSRAAYDFFRGRLPQLQSAMLPVVAVLGWILATQWVLGLTLAQISAGAAIPIASVPVLSILVFGLLVPIAETMFFFGVAQKFISQRLPNMLLLAGVMGALFALFHLNAHMGITGAVWSDFLFGFISSLLVTRTKELKEAGLAHMLANVLILLPTLGVLI